MNPMTKQPKGRSFMNRTVLQSEQSASCSKPPRKKKLNAPKQKDATENCMAGLAAQIQFDRFRKAVERQAATAVLARNAPPVAQDGALVPCNSGNGRHWFLLTLLPKQFQILVLDSTAGSFIKPTANNAITKMWMLLNELDATIDASHLKYIANKPTAQ